MRSSETLRHLLRPATAIAAAIGFAVAIVLWPTLRRHDHANRPDPAEVALGETLYRQHCAHCHGVDLKGQADWRQRQADWRLPAPPHDETGHSWHHTDAQLFALTKHGLGPYAPTGHASDMPAFADVLSDAEIRATIAFIKSRWPAHIQARHQQINHQTSQ